MGGACVLFEGGRANEPLSFVSCLSNSRDAPRPYFRVREEEGKEEEEEESRSRDMRGGATNRLAEEHGTAAAGSPDSGCLISLSPYFHTLGPFGCSLLLDDN